MGSKECCLPDLSEVIILCKQIRTDHTDHLYISLHVSKKWNFSDSLLKKGCGRRILLPCFQIAHNRFLPPMQVSPGYDVFIVCPEKAKVNENRSSNCDLQNTRKSVKIPLISTRKSNKKGHSPAACPPVGSSFFNRTKSFLSSVSQAFSLM